MKRKVWRSGNSWVVTIPSEIAEKLEIMDRKLIDFDINDVFEETENMFKSIFNDKGRFLEPFREMNKSNALRQPLADIRETENEIIVAIEIPGVDKKDIQLNITDNSLDVKVEKKSDVKIENNEEGFIKTERSCIGFYRSMRLPTRVVPEKAEASYRNGVLEVKIPKAEKENIKTNRIQIR